MFFSLQVTGELFDPPEDAGADVGMEILNRVVRGTVATTGRYIGRPIPYGAVELGPGELTLAEFAERITRLSWLESGTIESKFIQVLLAYDGQCNWELEAIELKMLAATGLPVTISAYEDRLNLTANQ